MYTDRQIDIFRTSDISYHAALNLDSEYIYIYIYIDR